MPKKQNESNIRERPDAAARYYEMKSAAMDDLLDAKAGKSKKYSMEELGKYRSHKGIHVADWVKIIFIKAWICGAVCFFFFWGLGSYIGNLIDMLFILGVALGFATDLLANSMIRFFERTPGANDRWMVFPPRKFISLVLNVLYSFLILWCVYSFYGGVNLAINTITGQADAVPLGVEPILFGILCMLFDLLFVGVKRMFNRVIRDARDKVEGKK